MSTTSLPLAFDTGGIISLLVGTLLPIFVGYITTEKLNSGLKAAILAGVSAISGVLSQWLDAINNNTHFAWQAAVLSAFLTWAVGEATYFKWWKPTGVSDYVQSKGITSSTPVDAPVDGGAVDAVDEPVTPDEPATPLGGPRHLAK